MDDCRNILLAGLSALHIVVNEQQAEALLAFISLMEKWNKAYNLTAIKSRQEMVRLHLLDSLTVSPYLDGQNIIDIGTGAGLPGIPLAICLPQLSFTLLDSNAKKTRFVQQAVLELKLCNVKIIHSRAEDFQPEQPFSTVLTRAFAELPDMIDSTRHLVAKNGILLAMKGQSSETEIAKVNAKMTIIPVQIPNVEAERNLVCIQLNNDDGEA
jgi:16S rRNA (guanine527-N7)-methyltransferase